MLTTDTFLRTERLLSKIFRRSLGDGCGGGTITAVIDLVEKSPGFDKCTSGIFSTGLELLGCNTIAKDELSIQSNRLRDKVYS